MKTLKDITTTLQIATAQSALDESFHARIVWWGSHGRFYVQLSTDGGDTFDSGFGREAWTIWEATQMWADVIQSHNKKVLAATKGNATV